MQLDPALGHSTTQRLREELTRGSWQGTESALEPLRDWDERAFVVGALSDWPGRPTWLDEWYRARARASALPALVRGAHSIVWAWEARGSGVGSTVDREAAALFASRLDAAERDLMEVAQRDPEDPTPWALLIATGMGRSQGPAVLAKRFGQAVQRDPDHRAAHARMLVASTEKWGGSHAAMFAFAREAVARATPGSSLHTLVAWAHIERWLAHLGSGGAAVGKGYMGGASVRKELLAARDGLLGAPLQAPACEALDRNILAFALWLAGEKTLAAEELRAIGDRISRMPWGFLGEPLLAFARARAACLGVGDPAVEEQVQKLCAHCLEHTRSNHRIELDYAWESIAQVDRLLKGYAGASAAQPGDAERRNAVGVLAGLYGAYVGEVVRRHSQGCWVADTAGGAGPPLPALVGEAGTFASVGLALAALLGRLPYSLEDAAHRWRGQPSGDTSAPAAPPAETVADRMRNAAERFVAGVREARIGMLAYNAPSLALVDRQLPLLRQGLSGMGEADRRQMQTRTALSLGAYLGETLCRTAGGVWSDAPAGEASAGLPVVDMGAHVAPVVQAALGFLMHGAVSLGDRTVSTTSEYVAELIRRQGEWLRSKICGKDTPEQLASAMSADRALGARLVNVLGTALMTARLKWGLDLDFSAASLEGLDQLLGQLHAGYRDGNPRPSDEQVGTMAACWGVYFGEVVRRHQGGQWTETPFRDKGPLLRLEHGTRTLLPLSRAQRCIIEGPDRSVQAYYQWLSGFASPQGEPPAALMAFVGEVARIGLKLLPGRGQTAPPFLLSQSSGSNTVESYALLTGPKVMAHARRRAAEQPAEVGFVAFVYDGYLGDGVEPKVDALMIEAHQRGLPTGFTLGQRYRWEGEGAVAVGDAELVGGCAPYLAGS